MKILFVMPGFGAGGAERQASYLLDHFASLGHECLFVQFLSDGSYELDSRIRRVSLGKRSAMDLPRLVFSLSRIIARERPDRIVSSLTYANLAAIVARMLAGSTAPLYSLERNYPMLVVVGERMGRIKMFLMSRLYPLATRVIGVSKAIADSLVREFGLPKDRVMWIYNGVPVERIENLMREDPRHPWFAGGRNPDFPLVVTAGRLSYEKRHLDLLAAFVKCLSRVKARCLIVGEGPERGKLERFVHDQRLQEYVSMPGFIANPYAVFRRAALFVLTSAYEGFPNVLLEAMACGVPVISTDCLSGPGEIITHGENGLLVPVGDPEALAEAMVRLLTDREYAKKLAQGGKERVKDFSLEVMAAAYDRALALESPVV